MELTSYGTCQPLEDLSITVILKSYINTQKTQGSLVAYSSVATLVFVRFC